MSYKTFRRYVHAPSLLSLTGHFIISTSFVITTVSKNEYTAGLYPVDTPDINFASQMLIRQIQNDSCRREPRLMDSVLYLIPRLDYRSVSKIITLVCNQLEPSWSAAGVWNVAQCLYNKGHGDLSRKLCWSLPFRFPSMQEWGERINWCTQLYLEVGLEETLKWFHHYELWRVYRFDEKVISKYNLEIASNVRTF